MLGAPERSRSGSISLPLGGGCSFQITFVTDGTGRATGLVLRHRGGDMPAQRID